MSDTHLIRFVNQRWQDSIYLLPECTPYQCCHLAWRISMSSRFMSVTHFPYLSIVTNPETVKQSLYTDGDPDRHQNLIVCCPLPTFPENFMQIRSKAFAQSC